MQKNKVKELESGKTDSNIDKKTTDKEFNSYKQLSRDNDKFTTNKNNDAIQRQIDSYKQIIDEYSDYDKYGKSNMAKWSAETKDMDYAQRQDYIKKLNTNNSQNKLEEKISGYESGKEYLNSLADGEKATAQGFFDYLDNNNRNFISEARRNGKTHRRKNRDYIILKKSQRSGKKEVMTGQSRQNILTRWPRAILIAMKTTKHFTMNMTKKERMQKVFRKRMKLSLIGTIIMVTSI
ncbi:MAG: hypothetical protein ACLUR5_06590 [Eubacterium ventriosum]